MDHLIVGSRATDGRGSPALAGFDASVVIFVIGSRASKFDGIESIAFQTKEVVDCMVHDSGLRLTELKGA